MKFQNALNKFLIQLKRIETIPTQEMYSQNVMD
jgi:hypothetical protein